ncbi:MAG: hypothetical protein KHX55_06830 [Proteobacteria bacterium]|nr:hypothetical protein [Pseudomonadota bacterium]
MRTIIKQASRANLWFFALTWLAALWAFAKFAILWPNINWYNVKEIVAGLASVAFIMLITAFFLSRLKSTNRRQRLHWTIVTRQQRSMATALLLEAGVILFIVLINHSLSL